MSTDNLKTTENKSIASSSSSSSSISPKLSDNDISLSSRWKAFISPRSQKSSSFDWPEGERAKDLENALDQKTIGSIIEEITLYYEKYGKSSYYKEYFPTSEKYEKEMEKIMIGQYDNRVCLLLLLSFYMGFFTDQQKKDTTNFDSIINTLISDNLIGLFVRKYCFDQVKDQPKGSLFVWDWMLGWIMGYDENYNKLECEKIILDCVKTINGEKTENYNVDNDKKMGYSIMTVARTNCLVSIEDEFKLNLIHLDMAINVVPAFKFYLDHGCEFLKLKEICNDHIKDKLILNKVMTSISNSGNKKTDDNFNVLYNDNIFESVMVTNNLINDLEFESDIDATVDRDDKETFKKIFGIDNKNEKTKVSTDDIISNGCVNFRGLRCATKNEIYISEILYSRSKFIKDLDQDKKNKIFIGLDNGDESNSSSSSSSSGGGNGKPEDIRNFTIVQAFAKAIYDHLKILKVLKKHHEENKTPKDSFENAIKDFSLKFCKILFSIDPRSAFALYFCLFVGCNDILAWRVCTSALEQYMNIRSSYIEIINKSKKIEKK